jgi:hypothetical protein
VGRRISDGFKNTMVRVFSMRYRLLQAIAVVQGQTSSLKFFSIQVMLSMAIHYWTLYVFETPKDKASVTFGDIDAFGK